MIAYDQYNEYISSIADADFLPEAGRLVIVYYAGEGTVCNVICLSDSSVETMQYDDISEVLFLEDGSMLLYRIEGDAGNVYRLDENHREELLLSLPGEAKGLAYSKDALYYIFSGAIYTVPAGDADSHQWRSNCKNGLSRGYLTEDGLYLACGMNEAILYPCSNADAQITLTVSGNMLPNGIDDWFSMHQEVRRGEIPHMVGDDFILEYLTRSTNVDVYFFLTENISPYKDLKAKGYLPPLERAGIQTVVSEMYPEIQTAVTHNGEIVGVPLYCVVQSGMGINKDVWKAIGKDENAIPQSWAELMQFVTVDWPNIAEAHPNVYLFNNATEARDILFYLIMIAYDSARQYYENSISYADEMLKNIFAAYEQIDFDRYSLPDGASDGMVLFSAATIDPIRQSEMFAYLPLYFFNESEPNVNIILCIGVLNPYSENIEKARDLLEYLAEHMEPLYRMYMCPGAGNEGIRVEEYETTKQEFMDAIDELNQRLLAEPSDVGRVPLEEELAVYNTALEDWENKYGWLASPECVLKYREMATGIGIYYSAAINEDDSRVLGDLNAQYLNGEISGNTFLETLNRITIMRDAES